MKKIVLALALILAPTAAFAQSAGDRARSAIAELEAAAKPTTPAGSSFDILAIEEIYPKTYSRGGSISISVPSVVDYRAKTGTLTRPCSACSFTYKPSTTAIKDKLFFKKADGTIDLYDVFIR